MLTFNPDAAESLVALTDALCKNRISVTETKHQGAALKEDSYLIRQNL